MKITDADVVQAILETVEQNVAEHSILKVMSVAVHDPFEFDATPDAQRVEIVINGRGFAVTVEPYGQVR